MSTRRLKTGDEVKILTGKDRGKTGKITQVFPALNRVVVSGVNIMKRHLRSKRKGESGRTIEFPMPIHRSNVARLEASVASQPTPPKRGRATKTSSNV